MFQYFSKSFRLLPDFAVNESFEMFSSFIVVERVLNVNLGVSFKSQRTKIAINLLENNHKRYETEKKRPDY